MVEDGRGKPSPPSGAQRPIQSPRQKPRAPSQILQSPPIRARQHLEFSCDAKRVPEFGQRPDGDVKKSPILPRAVLGGSLDDVRGSRKRSPPRLGCQPVELFSRERPRGSVGLEHELVTLLPCFESLIGCHAYQGTVGRSGLLHRFIASGGKKLQRD